MDIYLYIHISFIYICIYIYTHIKHQDWSEPLAAMHTVAPVASQKMCRVFSSLKRRAVSFHPRTAHSTRCGHSVSWTCLSARFEFSSRGKQVFLPNHRLELQNAKRITAFSCKFPYKVALVKCWHAFRPRRLAQSVVLDSGARHCSCKFPYKVAFVKRWHAFRLRRLAQSVVLGSGVRHFSCKFPHRVALVKCWPTFGLRRLAQSVVLGSGARHLSCKFPYKVALVTCWSAFRLRRLAQSACPRSESSWTTAFFL